jgi:hypothetical protein
MVAEFIAHDSKLGLGDLNLAPPHHQPLRPVEADARSLRFGGTADMAESATDLVQVEDDPQQTLSGKVTQYTFSIARGSL